MLEGADIAAVGRLAQHALGSVHAQQVDRLLRDGVEVAGNAGTLGAVGENLNGVLHTTLLRDAASGVEGHVIAKPSFAQAAQDVLGWGIAKRLGLDERVPAALVKSSGEALEEVVTGRTATSLELHSYQALEDLATNAKLLADPTLAPDAARAAAHTELELLNAIDHIVGNSDRTANNVLADAEAGVHYIDFGFAGASGRQRLRPVLLGTFLRGDGPGEMRLGAEARERLRALTADDLATLHAQLRRDLAAQPLVGGTARQRGTDWLLRRTVTKDRYLQDMQARLADLLDTGTIRYRPLTPWRERGVWLHANITARPGVAYALGAGVTGGTAIGAGELLRPHGDE